MRTYLRIFVLTAGCSLSLFGAAAPEPAAKPAAPSPKPVPAGEAKRPGYKFLRHAENWSYLAGGGASTSADFYDPVKYVPLNERGSIWISFGGHLWARAEDWGAFGFLDTPERDDSFGVARLLFHTDLRIGKRFRVFVETKNAIATDRALPGGRRPLDVDEVDLQEAFFDITIPSGGDSDFTFRAGRQHLLFGKQRLVSPLPWGNSLRTFDGFSGTLKLSRWQVTGFWTKPVPVRKFALNKPASGTQFYGVHATGKMPGTKSGMDVYWLKLDKKSSVFNSFRGREQRHTVGSRIWGNVMAAPVDYEVEAAYQFGSIASADVGAYSVASVLGYSFTEAPLRPRVFAGLDYASGDSGLDQESGTFNQLFPLGHAFLGFIDTVGRQNIVDLSSGATVQPHSRLTLGATGHNFWRANRDDALYHAGGGVVRLGGANTPSRVGAELDLTATYRLDRHTKLILGYSRFFAGEFLAATGPADDPNFTYLWLQHTF